MDDTTIQAAWVAPVPWVETYQRTHCDGSAAMRTFQSLIADEIVLPKSAIESKDPSALVLANVAFVNSMLNEAMLLPGEFAQEALWGYFAHDYVTQASQGGHVQYFSNRGGDELALRCAQSGLKSMIADPHLALFTEFVKLRRLDPKEARRAAVKAGFRNVDAQIRDLDRRLGELEQKEPLMPRHRTWLKSLRKLRLVPDDEMRANIGRIVANNPLHGRRRAEQQRRHVEAVSHDPAFATVKSLCDMAGLRFVDLDPAGVAAMRTIWPEGPKQNAQVWRVQTDRGERHVAAYAEGGLFKKRLAVLIAPGEALPQGSVALSKGEFATIAPQVTGA